MNTGKSLRILLWGFLAIPVLISIYQGYNAPKSSEYPPDFAIFRNAAEMVRSGEATRLYQIDAQKEFFFRTVGPSFSEFLIWNHPPIEALIYLPFAWMSYETGLSLIKIVNSIVLCMIALWAGIRIRSNPDAMFLLGLTLLLSMRLSSGTIATGQDSLWILLVLLIALASLPKRRSVAIALLFGLASVKFTIFLPLLAVLCIAGLGTIVLDALLASVLLWLIPLIVLDPSASGSYVRLCFNLISIDGKFGIHSGLLWNFRGILTHFLVDPGRAFWISIPAGIACAIVIRHMPTRLRIPLAVLVAAFFSPHIYQHDAMMYVGSVVLCIIDYGCLSPSNPNASSKDMDRALTSTG